MNGHKKPSNRVQKYFILLLNDFYVSSLLKGGSRKSSRWPPLMVIGRAKATTAPRTPRPRPFSDTRGIPSSFGQPKFNY